MRAVTRSYFQRPSFLKYRNFCETTLFQFSWVGRLRVGEPIDRLLSSALSLISRDFLSVHPTSLRSISDPLGCISVTLSETQISSSPICKLMSA
jgi:hypothetical protein